MENQTATGGRRTSEPLQSALAQLRAQRSNPALAMPAGSVHDGALLKARDAVRLKRCPGAERGESEGVVLGWYSNEPEKVVVSFNDGEVETLPRAALELIEPAA